MHRNMKDLNTEINMNLNEEQRKLRDILGSMEDFDAAMAENGGELTPELEAVMCKDEADLRRKIDGYHAICRDAESHAATVAAEIKRLQALKKHYENVGKSAKGALAFNMHRFGIEKLEGNFCVASFRKSQAVEFDEVILMEPYIKTLEICQSHLPAWVKVEYTVSKEALGQAIDNKEPIRGAAKVSRQSLQLK